MPVTVRCPRKRCEWEERAEGTDTPKHYCPDCAPNRRVRTLVEHDYNDPENPLSGKQ